MSGHFLAHDMKSSKVIEARSRDLIDFILQVFFLINRNYSSNNTTTPLSRTGVPMNWIKY